MDRFVNPEAFFLLLLLPLAAFFYFRAKRGPYFTSSTIFSGLPVSWRARLAFIPDLLFALGFILSVFALARPQKVLKESFKVTEGVAMELVVDRSSSMSLQMMYEGEWKSRLDIVKSVLNDFIGGGADGLSGRSKDLLGLVYFAKFSETALPLSLQHSALLDYIPFIQIASPGPEDGTSIGDALLLAASRLEEYNRNQGTEKDFEIVSKIIILLTDGENNAGEMTPEEAAEIAAKWGIKIYAIGFSGEETSIIVNGFGGRQRQYIPTKMNDEFLKNLAEISGGKYWQAASGDELKEVYEEIDRLETSRIKVNEYSEAIELYAYFLYAAALALALFALLSAGLFRRIDND